MHLVCLLRQYRLLLLDRRAELHLARLGSEVATAQEHEHHRRLADVHLKSLRRGVGQVVHVQEDLQRRCEIRQLALDQVRLVLPAFPMVPWW